MRKTLFFLFFILAFVLNGLYSVIAACESGDIDINTATLQELDGLSGIGPVKAQAIMDTRPFSSLEGLLDVNGIGNSTLDKIKTQGLACIGGQEENTTKNTNTQKETSIEEEKTIEEQPVKDKEKLKEDVSINNEETQKVESTIKESGSVTGEEIKTIVLSSPIPKDIKSESDKEQLNKNKLAIYGLIVFCILLVVLFTYRKIKDEKNEFR